MKSPSKKKIRLSKIFIFFVILLIITLIILLLYEFGIIGAPLKEEKTFRIVDDCSIVMNNLLHELKNEDSCRVMCFEECKIRDLNYQNYSFELKENACNNCFCTCN